MGSLYLLPSVMLHAVGLSGINCLRLYVYLIPVQVSLFSTHLFLRLSFLPLLIHQSLRSRFSESPEVLIRQFRLGGESVRRCAFAMNTFCVWFRTGRVILT